MTEAPPTTRQIACALRHFEEHSGNELVEVHGIYGPQSTDLATLYIRDLLGDDEWQWKIGAAKYAIDDDELQQHFRRVPREELRLGDIVVLYGTDTSELGTVGVFLRYARNGFVEVFTQTPMKPSKYIFDRRSVLGGLRYRRNTPALTAALVPAAPAEPRATLASWMVPGELQTSTQRFSTVTPDDIVAWQRDLDRRLPAEHGRRALDISVPEPAQHDGNGRHFREHWLKRLFVRGKR